jgi:hypothetical protein
MKNLFNENELPKAEMVELGLIDPDGNYAISQEDVEAMLAGRRTGLVRLNDLEASGFHIEHIDAKLSLWREADGKVAFKLHPIYKEAVIPELLEKKEAEQLMKGQIATVAKSKPVTAKQEVVYEYDPETREFISYDPVKVIVPDKINGYPLTDAQKGDWKKGLQVTLPDSTRVQHRATDPKGILADRAALVLSVLLDGGISYLLYRGIRHLLNSTEPQRDENTPAFRKAYAEMETHFASKLQAAQRPNEENRGYTRTHSR